MTDSFLALIWLCLSEYQKLCHVLSFAYVVCFEVESTVSLQDISPSTGKALLFGPRLMGNVTPSSCKKTGSNGCGFDLRIYAIQNLCDNIAYHAVN